VKPIPAIVESTVGQVDREIHAALIALRDSEAAETAHDAKGEKLREKTARHRLEVGRLLVQRRKEWPARGPKAKGWGEFLLRHGIDQDAALRHMRLAGYVEEISRTEPDVRETIPTVREVNAARRAEVEPDPVDPRDDWAREVESRKAPPVQLATVDIDAELARINSKVLTAAKQWPARGRRALAHELRTMADLIERMEDE
jgi:hypothetical protein